ncbi:MAG: cell division protein FtsW [Gammaproteobacteria bacterium]|nr:MAG: cell division protein FtsW [Gammaproteobacteria bacterium]
MPNSKKQSFLQRIFFGRYERSLSFQDIDLHIFLIAFSLVLFGIIMITSVSLPMTGGSLRMTISHLQKIFIALFLSLIVFRIPISFWQRNSVYFLLISLLMLSLVFLPFIGKEVNGAYRWIRILGFSFQPSELMKFSLIIYISSYCIRKYDEFKEDLLGFFKPVFVISLSILLVLLEPDLGSSVVLFIVSFSILYIAGAPLKHLLAIFFFGLITFIGLIFTASYRIKRIMGYLDPWNNQFSEQLRFSLSAISNGEWFGVGIGNSAIKEGFLSDAQTDFIFAVITEELGIIFGLFLILIFSYLIFRCFLLGRLARQNDFTFGSLVSYGIGVLIALHVFINIGVAIGLLPTKGITLPFISFGGSNLMLMFVLISLLQKIRLEINFSNKISV